MLRYLKMTCLIAFNFIVSALVCEQVPVGNGLGAILNPAILVVKIIYLFGVALIKCSSYCFRVKVQLLRKTGLHPVCVNYIS